MVFSSVTSNSLKKKKKEEKRSSSNLAHFFSELSSRDFLKGEAAEVMTTFDYCNAVGLHSLGRNQTRPICWYCKDIGEDDSGSVQINDYHHRIATACYHCSRLLPFSPLTPTPYSTASRPLLPGEIF